MAPTVVFVPGFWEGTECFDAVSHLLSQKSLATKTIPLLSTGTISPNNPSMRDDIDHIKSEVEEELNKGEDIVMVLHSGGGFLGSNALEGLSAKSRASQGLKGGVVGIVFLTGAVFPEGFKHGPLPFTEAKVISISFLPSQSLNTTLALTMAQNGLTKLLTST